MLASQSSLAVSFTIPQVQIRIGTGGSLMLTVKSRHSTKKVRTWDLRSFQKPISFCSGVELTFQRGFQPELCPAEVGAGNWRMVRSTQQGRRRAPAILLLHSTEVLQHYAILLSCFIAPSKAVLLQHFCYPA